jgi:hypothetical protein
MPLHLLAAAFLVPPALPGPPALLAPPALPGLPAPAALAPPGLLVLPAPPVPAGLVGASVVRPSGPIADVLLN